MTVDEAIRIAKYRAPVVTIGATAWHIGELEFKRIYQVVHSVDDYGKLRVFARCVDYAQKNCFINIPLEGLAVSPNTPQILLNMIYERK